ncbi:MAG TPA: hypothetical protein VH437_00675 [Terriglobales bacterium]
MKRRTESYERVEAYLFIRVDNADIGASKGESSLAYREMIRQ